MTSNTTAAQPAPAWVRKVQQLTTWLTEDLGGGPRPIKIAWAVNTHKVITAFIIYAMMCYFDNFSTGAWIYLAMHGVYGYCWLIKDATCRDASFNRRMTIPSTVMLYVGLIAWYWALPYLFISRHIEPSAQLLAACVAVHTFGVVLMTAADLQKNFILKMRKGLISDGVFAYTRNPNYLGEMLIYGTYAVLAAHWFGWLVVLWCWIGLFLPRMLAKDASISRHPGWAEYQARSGLLLPSWQILLAPFKRNTEVV